MTVTLSAHPKQETQVTQLAQSQRHEQETLYPKSLKRKGKGPPVMPQTASFLSFSADSDSYGVLLQLRMGWLCTLSRQGVGAGAGC